MRKSLKKLSVVLAVSLLISQTLPSYTADVSAAQDGDTFTSDDSYEFKIIDKTLR